MAAAYDDWQVDGYTTGALDDIDRRVGSIYSNGKVIAAITVKKNLIMGGPPCNERGGHLS